MAFDMYLRNKKEMIDHYEEKIFEIVNDNEAYPTLNWIWEKFYDSPRISPNQSNLIVHEMISLLRVVPQKDDGIIVRNLIIRLLPFFSEAFTSNTFIETASD